MFRYPNGLKGAQGNYVNGLREGQWFFWRETGEKWEVGTYQGGRADGCWLEWTREGTLLTRYYEHGKEVEPPPEGP